MSYPEVLTEMLKTVVFKYSYNSITKWKRKIINLKDKPNITEMWKLLNLNNSWTWLHLMSFMYLNFHKCCAMILEYTVI